MDSEDSFDEGVLPPSLAPKRPQGRPASAPEPLLGHGVDIRALAQEGNLSAKDLVFLSIAEKLLQQPPRAAASAPLEYLGDDVGFQETLRGGLRQVHNLSRMQERVHSDPKGLISEFFLEVRRDLECEPEEPMSLNTWRKNQAWGKHTTLNRCTAMDIG
jgi:hypothetical protein